MRGRVLNMEAAESRGSPVIPVNRGLYERLVRAARSGQPITYAEVGRLLELSMDYPPHRTEIHQLLGVISRHEAAKGRPMLSSVVLDHTDGTPGKAFYRLGQELGLVQPAEDEISFAIRQLNDTFAFWESPDAPSIEEALRSSGDESVPQAAFIPPPIGQPRGVVNALGDTPPEESVVQAGEELAGTEEPARQEESAVQPPLDASAPAYTASSFFEPPAPTSEPMPEFDPPGRPAPLDDRPAPGAPTSAPVFGQITTVRPPQPRAAASPGSTYAHAPRLPQPTEKPPALPPSARPAPTPAVPPSARPAATPAVHPSARPAATSAVPPSGRPAPAPAPPRPGFPVQSTAFPRSGSFVAPASPPAAGASIAPRAGVSATAPSVAARPVATAPTPSAPRVAPTGAPLSPAPEVREAASAAPGSSGAAPAPPRAAPPTAATPMAGPPMAGPPMAAPPMAAPPPVESAALGTAPAPAPAGERPKQPVMDPSGPRLPTTPLAGNKAIEDAAIRWVMQLERAAGRNPVDRRYDHAFPADIESPPRVIEVKAIGTNTRGWFLPIEVSQMEEARRNRNFYVYVVENTKQGDPTKFTLKVLGGTRLQQLLLGAKERRYFEVPWPTPHYDQTAGIEALSHGPDGPIAPSGGAASEGSATPTSRLTAASSVAPAEPAPTNGATATAASDVTPPPVVSSPAASAGGRSTNIGHSEPRATGAESEPRANGAENPPGRPPAVRENGFVPLADRIPTEG